MGASFIIIAVIRINTIFARDELIDTYTMTAKQLIIPIVALLYLSCSQIERHPLETMDSFSLEQLSARETKGWLENTDNYFVTQEDIEDYIHFLILSEGDSLGAFMNSAPVEYDDEVVFYELSFESGWRIISADKRGPIVLASSNNGGKSLAESNLGVQTWMNCLADDIEYRRLFGEEYYAGITEEALRGERYCLDMWDAIKANIKPTETKDGLPPPILEGHYELSYTYVTYESYELIQHLTSTTWYQHYPYNEYCPYKLDYSARCPAGCVAIAGAQMLYYLHYKIGVPVLSPSDGYCYGVEGNYVQGFSDYSGNTWDSMDSLCVNNFAALLVGDVGLRVGMSYSSSGSGASMADLPDDVFLPYGVDCTYISSYDSNIVFASLQDGFPVIFGGHRYESPFSWPGHCFLIDGYETYVSITHFVYEWVYDGPGLLGGGGNSINAEVPAPPPPYETTAVSSPYLYRFYLRWGDGGGYDNTPYATDGIWTYPGLTPYQYDRKMIYNFSIHED